MVFNGEFQCHLWIGNHLSMTPNPNFPTDFLDYIPKNHTDILDYKK